MTKRTDQYANRIGRLGNYRHAPSDLGRNIKRIQRERKLKQLALAQMAGVSVNTLTHMCQDGNVQVTVGMVRKVAAALDVDMWELFLPPPAVDDEDRA